MLVQDGAPIAGFSYKLTGDARWAQWNEMVLGRYLRSKVIYALSLRKGIRVRCTPALKMEQALQHDILISFWPL